MSSALQPDKFSARPQSAAVETATSTTNGQTKAKAPKPPTSNHSEHNGTTHKPLVFNDAGKVRISPLKNHSKSRENNSKPLTNGTHLSSSFQPQPARVCMQLPVNQFPQSFIPFPVNNNSQRKTPDLTIVNQLSAILSQSAPRTEKLPIPRPADDKNDSSKRRKSSKTSNSSPVPPLRSSSASSKSNASKTIPIAPLNSRPQQMPQLVPFPFFLSQAVLQQQVLQQQFMPQNIMIPSSILFPNGITNGVVSPPRMLSPISPPALNLIPVSGPLRSSSENANIPSSTPQVKRQKKSKPEPPTSVPKILPKTTTVNTAPIVSSVSDDLDQLLSSVQSKISQDFQRASPPSVMPVQNAPKENAVPALKATYSIDEKILRKKVKEMRRRRKIVDVALERKLELVRKQLEEMCVGEKPKKIAAQPETPKTLPFKKRQYKSVPSPKDAAVWNIRGFSRDEVRHVSAAQSQDAQPSAVSSASPTDLAAVTSSKPPPIKLSLKLNRDVVGNTIAVPSPNRSSRSPSTAITPAKKKRKSDELDGSMVTPPKKRGRKKKVISNDPAEFQLEENVYSTVKLRKPTADKELHKCVCKRPITETTENACGDECHSRVLFFECDPESCECGPTCTNQVIQKRQSMIKDLEVFDTVQKGRGVRCRTKIAKDKLVCEYLGEVVTMEKFRQRMAGEYKESPHHYCLNIDANTVIDAYRKGNLARFINHSCDPNCRMEKWHVDGRARMVIFANRDIEAGEELTYDYNFHCYEHQQACLCGARNCRKIIGSKKQKLGSGEKKEKKEADVEDLSAHKSVIDGSVTVLPIVPLVDYSRPEVLSFIFLHSKSKGKNGVVSKPEGILAAMKRKIFLRRTLRPKGKKGRKKSRASRQLPASSMPLLTNLTAEALAELRQQPKSTMKQPSSTPVAAVNRTGNGRLPTSHYKPTHWKPDVRKYTEEFREEVIRCICNTYTEFGKMIMCDQCQAWQHCECVGIVNQKDAFLCERCSPRPFNTEIHQNLPSSMNPDNLDCYVTLNVPNCQNFRVRTGDGIYLTPDRSAPKPDQDFDPRSVDMLYVDKLFIDSDGTKRAYGYHLLWPHETQHKASKVFFENELLRSPVVEAVKLEAVLGRFCVMDPATYAKGKPREYPIEHCYIYEFKACKKGWVGDKASSKDKIAINMDHYYFETYPEPLTLVRTYYPHGVPVSKKLPKGGHKKSAGESKPLIQFVTEKCQRIAMVVERLHNRPLSDAS